ncbi:MAG TPA: AraC family transcriptional regulator [Allosphingosinicella sp.]|nr:AraC family transcriptional regulator [Allosphingosinicella sp.]
MGQKLPGAGAAGTIEWIEVSPEMTTLIGRGAFGSAPLPADPVVLSYELGGPGVRPAVRIGGERPRPDSDSIFLVVAEDAWRRLGGAEPGLGDGFGHHLPSDLRAIALALRDPAPTGESRNVYRLAKSIELLCETVRLLREGALAPLAAEGGLSVADTGRLMAARRIIDERWQEKLTLATIARDCGLNRAKLTGGFRDLFGCTIAEALAERRLAQASRMLLTTDQPVSSIGYANGYLNNASFARAFGRRFGVTPSGFRQYGAAA